MRKTQDSPSIPRTAIALRTKRPSHSRVADIIATLFLALASVPAAIGSPSYASLGELSQGQAPEGWLRLFDGQSQFGWSSSPTGGASWHASAGVLVSDPAQPGAIRTTTSFSDFDLKFEARITGPGATLLFRADPQSKPAQPGFNLSLNDGSIADLGSSPAAASSDWSTYELNADGTHVTASINGRVTADDKSGKNRVGYFEFNSPRGTRIEIRSITLKPLNLDSLYNGSNLDGWKAVSAPPPESKSKVHLPIPGLSGKPKAPPAVRWTGQGTIHGQGGVGQLESALAYDDFVLQFSARLSGKSSPLGAEVFFRATPNQFDTGYAVSATSDSHATYGTGSLVKIQKSRILSVAPGQFFVGTVIARAHRFSVWINGALVTDYYDSRPEGSYHSAAGPLGFRLQNEKAGLDLRDVRAATLPKGPEPPPLPAPVVAAAPAPVVPSSTASAPAPIILPNFPGQSQDKAQQEQVRKLTVDALSASSPEEAIRINKQILVLDPGDMPAQQRLDKAQAEIDAANAQRERGREQQQTSAVQLASNAQRRDQLLSQAQDDVLTGHVTQANDHLNDAQRLGAAGPEVDRLHSLIASRIRNRLLTHLGLGGTGIVALTWAVIYWYRRRKSALVAYLVALDGVDKGKRYALTQEVTHIGGVAMDGGKKNEVLVHDPDRQVSRFHCEVHKRGNSCYLVDLASSNGTYLRSRPLQPGVAARLRDGDKFTLAHSVAFELRIERQIAS
jgi:hypothetical protein